MTRNRSANIPWGLLMRIGLAFAAALLLAGCSSDPAVPTHNAASVPLVNTTASDRVPIEWFVGFGTGARPEQIDAQQQVVDRFNGSQTDIELSLTIGDWSIIYELLDERLAAGSPPDIIGPIGRRGSGALNDQFLDLRPWIEKGALDISNYAPAQLGAETQLDGRINGLPFGVFPSMLFIDRQAFTEAGLPTPPQRFGELYRGEPWDMRALRRLASELTLDANGATALDSDFDSERIVQWGFHHQFLDDARSVGTFFGAGTLLGDDGTAQIPPQWLDAWTWYHDMIWTDRSAPNVDEINSPVLDFADPFKSGNVAMAFSHSWYAGSMRAEDGSPLDTFDLAVVPSYNDQTTSNLHADTFRVFSATPHPDEAVQVLEYLLGEAAPTLLETYSSFPARLDLQPSFETSFQELFPSLTGVSVIQASLEYPDVPSHEDPLPNFEAAEALIREFHDRVLDDKDLDVDDAADALRAALDIAFAAAPA